MAYFNIGQTNEYIIDLQDKYLAIENNKKELINFEDVKEINFLNLFNIKADMLVTFTDKLLGGETDLSSINNQISINGGIQINEGIYNLIKENYGVIKFDEPYIVNGYNLPYNYICKVAIKNIENQTLDEENKLINSFNKLIDFIKETNIKNIIIYFSGLYKFNFNKKFLNNFKKIISKQFKKKKMILF